MVIISAIVFIFWFSTGILSAQSAIIDGKKIALRVLNFDTLETLATTKIR